MRQASSTARSSSAARWANREFTGEFQLREGRLELYRTNLIISNLLADGKFAGDELRSTAGGDTAKGKLDAGRQFQLARGRHDRCDVPARR